MALPKVAVVVLNYNRLELTRRCLHSLREVDYRDYEVVVVDNGSRDGSAQELPAEFPSAHFIFLSENRGFTGGNNAGIEWCLAEKRFDAVLILNNDAAVDANLLDRLALHFDPGNIAAPQIRSVREPGRAVGLVGRWDWWRGIVRNTVGSDSSRTEPVPVEFAAACCLLIPTRLFETVGLFDDVFFLYYEDADFLVRAARQGVRIIYEPTALVYHDEAGSSDGTMSPLRLYYSTRNRLYFMRKHSGSVRFAIFIAYFAAGRVLYALFYCATRRWSHLSAMIRGVVDYKRHKMGPRVT